jgi:hypothetical protein
MKILNGDFHPGETIIAERGSEGLSFSVKK